jgi:hypothetical protein
VLPSQGVPAPIAPLVTPPLAGEGQWHTAGTRLAGGGYGVYTTTLRPAGGYPAAGVAWIDSATTRAVLYAGSYGSGEPPGVWPNQGGVPAAAQPSLVAAFNGGFKMSTVHTGWYDHGRTAIPLQAGVASFVIHADGTATVADWGRDATLTPSVVSVRQNLPLLVDHGAPAADVGSYRLWGAVLGGGVNTWRSGVGVTAGGDLVYVAGNDLGPGSLAGLLVAAGAVRAMELDINPAWVNFATFTSGVGTGGSGGVVGTNLLATMHAYPGHFLAPYSRDYFAVFSR